MKVIGRAKASDPRRHLLSVSPGAVHHLREAL
jgi:hypothetical protein